MLRLSPLFLLPFLLATGCDTGAALGESCLSDEDCAGELSCHKESEDDTAGPDPEEVGLCTEHQHDH